MDFSSLISDLSSSQVGGAALIGLVGFMILGALKGLMRVLLGIAGFIAAAVAFWLAFRHGDRVLALLTDSPEPWMPLGVAGGAGVAAYTTVRHGLGMIFRPLIGSLDALKKHRVLSSFAGLGLGGLGLMGGSSAIQQVDAMEVLDQVQRIEPLSEGKLSWLKELIIKGQDSWIGQLQERLDPTQTTLRCTLIKALGIYTGGQAHLYQHSELQPLVQNTAFQRLASSPEIAQRLTSQNFQDLMRDPAIVAYTKEREHRQLLQDINWGALQ